MASRDASRPGVCRPLDPDTDWLIATLNVDVGDSGPGDVGPTPPFRADQSTDPRVTSGADSTGESMRFVELESGGLRSKSPSEEMERTSLRRFECVRERSGGASADIARASASAGAEGARASRECSAGRCALVDGLRAAPGCSARQARVLTDRAAKPTAWAAVRRVQASLSSGSEQLKFARLQFARRVALPGPKRFEPSRLPQSLRVDRTNAQGVVG